MYLLVYYVFNAFRPNLKMYSTSVSINSPVTCRRTYFRRHGWDDFKILTTVMRIEMILQPTQHGVSGCHCSDV